MENCESRNSLEVSQSCGLKNDLLCSRPLRALQPLVQQTSSGPAVTWRTVNELLLQSPLCQVGCATSPEAITLLPSLGDDRPGLNWTSRRLHSPISDGIVHLGARSLHSPVTLDRPGRLVIIQTARTVNWQLCRFRDCCVSVPPLCFSFAQGFGGSDLN